MIRKLHLALLIFVILLFLQNPLSGQGMPADSPVQVSSGRQTIFSLLNEISRQTGVFFIYDSQLIDNEKQIRIRKGTYTTGELLEMILTDPSLTISFVEKYGIIHPRDQQKPVCQVQVQPQNAFNADTTRILIYGRVVDAASADPLPYAGIIIKGRGQGISSNADGHFNLSLPAGFRNDTIKISYMGYAAAYIPVELFPSGRIDIALSVEAVALQEVVVKSYDPYEILQKAISRRNTLYPQRPSLQTSFYRESIFREDELLSYSEAVFNIYKSAYRSNATDQVRMIKSRKISNNDENDTLRIKLRAGIQSMLELDVVKNPPDFLISENLWMYKLPGVGIVPFEKGMAYAINFENAGYNTNDVYEGTIYIDAETYAVLQVDFNITQSYLRRNQHHFITRRSKLHNSRIRYMNYSVRYAPYAGSYHIQHVKGEIGMRVRERNRIWGKNYQASFEMAVMEISYDDVRRFSRRETLRPHVIFTDQEFEYDADFWAGFNFIIPEQKITSAIRGFNAGVEQMEEEVDN
jgi:hypothetical protein